ncbi:MAG: hypothetical protein E6G37_12975 [Actinobacteria bacterium]|nr:MAG: hypothetical protein E6G37_12975 [Actinomycetota bacterium]
MSVAIPNVPTRMGRRRGILASRKGRVGFAILLALIAIAVFAPLIAPHDPNSIDASRILAGPDCSASRSGCTPAITAGGWTP